MTSKHVPIRRCAGCGERKPQAELVRIAADIDGTPVIDKGRKLTGRGIYSCANLNCFDRAMKRKTLKHGLRLTGVTEDQIETLRGEFPEVNE